MAATTTKLTNFGSTCQMSRHTRTKVTCVASRGTIPVAPCVVKFHGGLKSTIGAHNTHTGYSKHFHDLLCNNNGGGAINNRTMSATPPPTIVIKKKTNNNNVPASDLTATTAASNDTTLKPIQHIWDCPKIIKLQLIKMVRKRLHGIVGGVVGTS